MKKYSFLLLAILLLASCSPKKNIIYFQDAAEGSTFQVTTPLSIKIEPQDKLSILVNTSDDRLNQQFNLKTVQTNTGNTRNLGYTVNSFGDIDFPFLGEIHVAGLTRTQVAEKIKKLLQEKELVKDPVVTVDFLNLGVTVLGEVKSPGRVNIEKDQLTILEALAQSGDLTIHGIRDGVYVYREEDGIQKTYRVDLTDAAQVYSSPVYYLQQDDIVYVQPNQTKANQSELNANTVRTPAFWMSLCTFLSSMALIFVKL